MYKIKEGAELPKEFKIKVNPKQSEAIQKHLISLGVSTPSFSDEISYLDANYLYKYDYKNYLCADYSKSVFKKDHLPRIKFKQYFEKLEETSFPEKWCIKVTEDNYHDLKDWMYKNFINYVGFKVGWFKNKHLSIGQTFYSHGYFSWNKPRTGAVHQEITTEQFRNQFSPNKPNSNTKKIAELEAQIKSLSNTINLYKNIINRINNSLNSFDLP